RAHAVDDADAHTFRLDDVFGQPDEPRGTSPYAKVANRFGGGAAERQLVEGAPYLERQRAVALLRNFDHRGVQAEPALEARDHQVDGVRKAPVNRSLTGADPTFEQHARQAPTPEQRQQEGRPVD